MTNHKKLIDFTASLDRNCLSFTKEKVTLDQSVNMPYGSCMLLLIGSWKSLLNVSSGP